MDASCDSTGQAIALFGQFVAEATRWPRFFASEKASESIRRLRVCSSIQMSRKKPYLSLFSTIVQQINEQDSRRPANDCHLIDNEYFAAFDSLDDIQHFHAKLNEKQQKTTITDNESDVQREDDMEMKSFAQQFLIDLPEQVTKDLSLNGTSSQDIFITDQPINWSPKMKGKNNVSSSADNKKRKSAVPVKLSVERTNKRQRRHIRDLPQSSEFIFTSDNDDQHEYNAASDLLRRVAINDVSNHDIPETMTSSHQTAMTPAERTVSFESSPIKKEPIESEQVTAEPKQEPLETNMRSGDAMSFATSQFAGDLDNYVQNIHLLRQPSSLDGSTSVVSSRPKRIRKQKKFYIEESELPTRSKKVKTPMQKKRPSSQITSAVQLTDAEIEHQFGERLSLVKSEQTDDDTQQLINSRVIIEFEPVAAVPQTSVEKARAKLTAALGRGHDPDTYLLKIRSREHKIIEVQLAIYGTADWHSQRAKILAKIEEALRGLRVSWTKIDIVVDDFDVQISTSSHADSITPPTSAANTNASWFLKALSESGPLIVHIHDRRCPQQRFRIKCACPECSPVSMERSMNSSLPVIVNGSPATTPTRRLTTPSILHKTSPSNISSSHNITTSFFNDLIHQYGRNTVISVTQCVLDLALIVSVHASLPSLCVSPNFPHDEYKQKYQQIIDPLKCTLSDNEKMLLSKTSMVARVISMNATTNAQSIVQSKPIDILSFYQSIHENNANIRSAKSMRHLITTSFSTHVPPTPQPNLIKARSLILPKPTTSLSLCTAPSARNIIEIRKTNEQDRRSGRHSSQTSRADIHEPKQQALCTPIIELKPILSGSTTTAVSTELKKASMVKSTDTELNEQQPITTEVTASVNNSARVIRLSIAKSTSSDSSAPPTASSVTSSPTIRLVASSKQDLMSSANAVETVPLVPKQINIIKPLSSTSTCLTPAIKLSNLILIANKLPPPPPTK